MEAQRRNNFAVGSDSNEIVLGVLAFVRGHGIKLNN